MNRPPPHIFAVQPPQSEADLQQWLWWLAKTGTSQHSPEHSSPKELLTRWSNRRIALQFFQHLSNCKELIYCYNSYILSLVMSKQGIILLLSQWNSYMDAALASKGRTEEALLHHIPQCSSPNHRSSAASIHSCSFAEIPATLSSHCGTFP